MRSSADVPLLAAKSLTRDFRVSAARARGRRKSTVRAVNDVDLHIHRGEAVGLVGESGCGKTTMSRLLLLLTRPTAGTVLFNGAETAHMSRDKYRHFTRHVQPVFQDPLTSLDPRMQVGRIISEPLRAATDLTRQQRVERVSSVLEQVGLAADDAFRHPWEFSGGQKQRIAIARALIPEPQLIILDEAVASQDVSIRAQLLNLLQDIRSRTGIAYLFISHDLSTVRYLCDRIYVMYCGRIVEQGPTEELCGSPRHPYTQALFEAWLPPDPQAARARASASGDVPSAIDPPSGCAFHPRCPHAMPVCRQRVPRLEEFQAGRQAACHLDPAG
jgi:oligopeptide/dipeptide ABC transporter ATP-binding protein